MKVHKPRTSYRPLTPADMLAKVGPTISIPTIKYDANGRATLGHKTTSLLTKKNVG